MGFAFLQKMPDGVFHTVQPASPCKDYLAEVVFTEKHGIPTRAYGLNYKKQLNIFSDVAYMAIKMMPTKGGGGYNYSSSLKKDTELLAKNYKNITRLINDFEKKVGLKILTTIEPANNDYFLLKFSSKWCDSTHSISLYSLLIRVLMVAESSDKDIMSFLKAYKYHSGDKNLVQQSMKKIESILKTKKLPPNAVSYSKSRLLSYHQTPHNNGIIAWNSSFTELKIGA